MYHPPLETDLYVCPEINNIYSLSIDNNLRSDEDIPSAMYDCSCTASKG